MLAPVRVDIQIAMYRLWLAGRPCQHPKRAVQRDNEWRTCRVCGHAWRTLIEVTRV